MSDPPADEVFQQFNELFEDFFGAVAAPRGNDLRIPCEITLAEAIDGCTRALSFRRQVLCADCKGTGCVEGTGLVRCPTCDGQKRSVFSQGQFRVSRACADCRGLGTKPESPCGGCRDGLCPRDESLSITVPPGTRNDDTINLAGKGNERANVPSGDAHVVLTVALPEGLTVDGDNLRTTLTLTMAELRAGGTFTAAGTHGPARVTVAPGSHPGDVVTVRGAGLARSPSQAIDGHYRDAAARGDWIVTLHAATTQPPYGLAVAGVVLLGLLLGYIFQR